MRIISGLFKGKSINFLKSLTTRPLKDSVRENIFNIILHSKHINVNLRKSKVLDLYSGVGSFGIECISRGSSKIVFVEKSSTAIQTLKKNLISLSVIEKVSIKSEEVVKFLESAKKEKFQIIFFDPPFSENNFIKELKLIKSNKMFSNEHVVIIHREKKSVDDLEGIMDVFITKNYGRSKVIFGKF